MQATLVYKILRGAEWTAFRQAGIFIGAPVDLADGFIHFSTRDQVGETLRRHFSGQSGLVLLAVDATRLGEALRAEPSRGGALFPHLYAPLSISNVVWDRPIGVDADGHPVLPDLD